MRETTVKWIWFFLQFSKLPVDHAFKSAFDVLFISKAILIYISLQIILVFQFWSPWTSKNVSGVKKSAILCHNNPTTMNSTNAFDVVPG